MPKDKHTPRLAVPAEKDLNPSQRRLVDAISAGPRGKFSFGGPFAVWLHAPEYGALAQKLGGFCRYQTSVPPRLSEFAILCIARFWRSQYEWYAHAPIAEKAGVKAKTIADLRAGRVPASAPKDERAIHDFVQEMLRKKRVSDKTYAKVHALFGDAGMVEFIGILGYYTSVSFTLNGFRVPLPEGEKSPFREPVV